MAATASYMVGAPAVTRDAISYMSPYTEFVNASRGAAGSAYGSSPQSGTATSSPPSASRSRDSSAFEPGAGSSMLVNSSSAGEKPEGMPRIWRTDGFGA